MAERAQIVVTGVVQGVGFRPHVFSLASALALRGYVTNTGSGVFIEIEGDGIEEFIRRLRTEVPPLASVSTVTVTPLPPVGYADFTIRSSTRNETGSSFARISPDVGLCEDCFRELTDPADRRYLYPFINCTNCGPRYTITTSVPYDRPNTTMADFAMCPACRGEYDDPASRRFHAQPNACPVCGPTTEFRLRSAECGVKGDKAVLDAVLLLKSGGIVAIRGIGGFHIACDAENDDAVKRLRERKRKNNKPFAVMAPDTGTIERFCHVNASEKSALESIRRPIVLLRKRESPGLPDAVSPNNRHVGCMLPYTPLHQLLFMHPMGDGPGAASPHFAALVMTSGNLAEEPIIRDNDEALQKLDGIVDGYLLHNRGIFMRADDSVVRVRSAECAMRYDESAPGLFHSALRIPYSELSFIRRSRGYVPDPIALQDEGPEVLGAGADVKNTFTLTKDGFAVPSQHIGDMENYETLAFFEETLENLKAVYRVNPVAIAHDLHPGYYSTRWAIECGMKNAACGVKTIGIQHHYAHIGSVMAEQGLLSRVIGVAFDGTGYGTDGNLWGGEFLVADIEGFERVGQLRYVPLPGGEAAVREPWKTALSFLAAAGGNLAPDLVRRSGFAEKYGQKTIDLVLQIARNAELSPLASGAGRLFDAVSALLGVCDRNTFEGEAAMALEALVQPDEDGQYVVEIRHDAGYTTVDFSAAFSGILRDRENSVPVGVIAAKFHNTVSTVIRSVVKKVHEQTGITAVVLSGGTFQNQYLLQRITRILEYDGMQVYTNTQVPCNDGGISLGQAYIVRERLKKTGAIDKEQRA